MSLSPQLTIDNSQQITINGSIDDTYGSLIRRLTDDNVTPDNRRMPMVLEQWPGGRWFRDLGDGHGHLWGFVQVIKPPSLIEIQGPMFMSYAVAGHIQFRLTAVPDGTELALRHRVLGLLEPAHREGVNFGWRRLLDDVKSLTE